jgi:hypothetical protein
MKIDLYCVCWNEVKIAPFVVEYWKRFVNHVYVYDNGSNDGTLKFLKKHNWITIRHFDSDGFNDEVHMSIKNNCWKNNTEADWIVVCDFDECLFCDNLEEKLNKFVSMGIDIVVPTWNTVFNWDFPEVKNNKLVHETADTIQERTDINSRKAILFYKKTVQEMGYGVGCHTMTPVHKGGLYYCTPNDNINLYHLKHLGVDYTYKRCVTLKKRLSEINKNNGWGTHYDVTKDDVRNEFVDVMNKTAVLYLCHVNTPYAEQNLKKLCDEAKGKDVWLVYDESNQPLTMKIPSNCQVYTYNRQKIEEHGYAMHYWYPLRRGDFYGHNFEYVIPCFFHDNGKKYKYIWTVEYDVYCCGSWNIYFDKYNKDTSDFIANRIKPLSKDWYNIFKVGTGRKAEEKYTEKYNTFNPIMRFSNKGLNYICKELTDGQIYGFYEWLYVTMMKYGGLKVNSIDEENVIYLEKGEIDRNMVEGKLYHPIKSLENIKVFRSTINICMTSWKGRINKIMPTLNSLFAQTLHPDNIWLTLCSEELEYKDIPDELKELDKEGKITLVWVESNTKTFKKVFPVLPYLKDDDIIIIADDDIIFDKDFIKWRIEDYKEYNAPISPVSEFKYDEKYYMSGSGALFTKRMLNGYKEFCNKDVIETYEDDWVYSYLIFLNGYKFHIASQYYTNEYKFINQNTGAYRRKLYDTTKTNRVLIKRWHELLDVDFGVFVDHNLHLEWRENKEKIESIIEKGKLHTPHLNIDVYCICWNEMKVLPFAIDYWKRFARHVYVYDNGSDDGTIELLGQYDWITVRHFDSDGINEQTYLKVKNHCWKGSDADYVVVCDIDECIYSTNLDKKLKALKEEEYTVIVPKWGDIWGERFKRYKKGTLCHELYGGVYFTDNEFVHKALIFDPKEVKEMNYMPGCHNSRPEGEIKKYEAKKEDDLYVVHLKRLGPKYICDRYGQYAKRMSQYNKRFKFGHEYLTETKKLREIYVDEYSKKKDNLERLPKLNKS